MSSNYWSKNDSADFEQFYYNIFDSDEPFSLSELDIKYGRFYFVSSAFNLSFLHSTGHLHRDYHIGNLFFEPLTGSGNSCDPDTIIKCDINPRVFFFDFLAPYFSFHKDDFHAFLVGYFKSAVVILDNKIYNYSQDLLELVGGHSKLLISERKNESHWRVYFCFLENEKYNSNTSFYATITFENFNKIKEEDKFIFFFFSQIARIEIVNIDDKEFFINLFTESFIRYCLFNSISIEREIAASLIAKWSNILEGNFRNLSSVESDDVLLDFRLVLELLEISNVLLGEKSILLWQDIIVLFDLFSLHIDSQNEHNNNTDSSLDISINLAQASLIILQKLSIFTNELHHLESIELGIKKRQFSLSWLISPLSPNWEGERYQMTSIRMDEPADKLLDELTKYTNSYENWQYDKSRFLKEFQYYNSLVITLNKLFNTSLLFFKEGKSTNLLWTSAFRALSYARRNLFIITRYILEEVINEKREIISQVCVVCVSQLKYTLVNYWKQTNDYFGADRIENFLEAFSESYEKLINEMKSILDFENKIYENAEIIFKDHFRENLLLLKNSIVRKNCFPF